MFEMTFTGRSLIPTVVSCSFYATDYFMITKWQLPTALSLMGVPTLMANFQCLNRHHWCFSVFAVTIYITGLSEYMSAWCISPLVVGLLLVASSLLHLVSPAGLHRVHRLRYNFSLGIGVLLLGWMNISHVLNIDMLALL